MEKGPVMSGDESIQRSEISERQRAKERVCVRVKYVVCFAAGCWLLVRR